jgi:WD40 repeat protein
VFPDGRRVVSGSFDKTLKVWDVATGECVATLEGHSERVVGVAISPDGRRVVSGSHDQTLKLWGIK